VQHCANPDPVVSAASEGLDARVRRDGCRYPEQRDDLVIIGSADLGDELLGRCSALGREPFSTTHFEMLPDPFISALVAGATSRSLMRSVILSRRTSSSVRISRKRGTAISRDQAVRWSP
jgi:hypothetical protein